MVFLRIRSWNEASSMLAAHATRASCSVGLLRYFVVTDRADYFLALDALVPGFHEVAVRFRGDSLPFAGQNVDGTEAVVIGALADERHALTHPQVIFNGVVEALVRFAETLLVLLSVGSPRGRGV
jgi:hypothetical protein